MRKLDRVSIHEIWDPTVFDSFHNDLEFMQEVSAEASHLRTDYGLSSADADNVAYIEIYLKWRAMMPEDFKFFKFNANKAHFYGKLRHDITGEVSINLNTHDRKYLAKSGANDNHIVSLMKIQAYDYIYELSANWPASKFEAGIALKFLDDHFQIDEKVFGGSSISLEAMIAVGGLFRRAKYKPILQGHVLLNSTDVYNSGTSKLFDSEEFAYSVAEELNKRLIRYKLSMFRVKVKRSGSKYLLEVPNILAHRIK